MTSKLNERDIESKIDLLLEKLGWVSDINSSKRNVFRQKAKTEEENKKLSRKRPDYILYHSKSNQPLIIIEAKKPGESLKKALNQGVNYAKKIDCPIVIATDGVYTKTYHIKTNKELILNGEVIEEIISEKIAILFLEENEIFTINKDIIKSRKELIDIFEVANNLLRSEGLEAGLPRFTEFSNILFLKLISELADLEISPHTDIPKEFRWEAFKNLKGIILLNYVNNTVLKHFKEKYNEDSLFENLVIKNPETLEEIIGKLDKLNLTDINADIKGDAFEHFLKSYSLGENDLGQYFTPRHIVKFIVKLINPNFGEIVFDPFCGTGGILIESFKHLFKSAPNTEMAQKILKEKSIYGSEITKTARIAKMNMILMGDGHSNIIREDSLQNIKRSIADCVITNIPFAQNTKYGNLYPINSELGNSVCIQHCILSLKKNGRGAIIVQEGFLFDKKYKKTREWLMNNVRLKYIISLEQGVFLPYTNAKTSIIVFDNKGKKTQNTDDIYFVEILNDGFSLNNHREKIQGKNDIENFLEIVNDLDTFSDKILKDNKIVKKKCSTIIEKSFILSAKKYENSKEIDSRYNLVTIESVCESIVRGPFGSSIKKSICVEKGIRIYEQNVVIGNDFSKGKYYLDEDYFESKFKRFEIKEDDILMTCAGTLGKIAIVPNGIERGIINSVLTYFRVKKEIIIPKYFEILMKSEFLQYELVESAIGTGIKNMRPIDEIKKLLIPLPTISEQKEIIKKYNELEIELKNIETKLNFQKEKIKNFNIL